MESLFGSSYKGDPGVPHSGQGPFWNIWIGAVGFSALSSKYPYMWQLTNQYNWHDKAFLFEQYHWKKARMKNKPYEFQWNEIDKVVRDSYYFHWPVFFP